MYNQYNALLDKSVDELTELEKLYDKVEEENKILKQYFLEQILKQINRWYIILETKVSAYEANWRDLSNWSLK